MDGGLDARKVARWQNVIPSFPLIAPPRPPLWRNARKGRDQILPSGNPDLKAHDHVAVVEEDGVKVCDGVEVVPVIGHVAV